MPSAAEGRRHLAAIAALPRPAGSDAETAARDHCARTLRDLGFSVTEEPFAYSAFPGRLATPIAGACSIIALAAAGHAGSRGNGALALLALAAIGIPVAGAAWWMARQGVLTLPWMRARSRNLVAVRGAPRLWLMAHLDSKSQPVPIGVRALGIVLTGVVWVAAVVTAGAQLLGIEAAAIWPWISAMGALAGVPIAASVVRGRSPGALDNASGVATVLLAAGAVPVGVSLGIALTSAEELGLAGARAWVRGRAAATAINVDGVDDDGWVRIMWTGKRPARLVGALIDAARVRGVMSRGAHLLPGILTDGVALAAAGWEVVTVSKGTVRTAGRIHTQRDVASAIEGRGLAAVAGVIADAIRGMR